MEDSFQKKFKRFRKAVKRNLRLGLDRIFSVLNYLYSILFLRYTILTFFKLKRTFRKHPVERLHVGCGPIFLKGWCNVFYETGKKYGRFKWKRGAGILNYDLVKPWPWEENSLQFIAGAHFIEHIDLDQCIEFCQRAHRVLKPGGVIRFSCPDLEAYAKHYIEDSQEFYAHPEIRHGCYMKSAETPSQIFAAKAYDIGAHKWFHDFSSLKNVLERTGFSHVRKVTRLEGGTPDLEQLEAPHRETETLYIEATNTAD